MLYNKDQITELQRVLTAMKAYSGRADGLVGPLSIAALEKVLAEFKSPTSVIVPPSSAPATQAQGFTAPKFVEVPGVKFKTHAYAKGTPEGLVVHFTVSGRTEKDARGVLSYLAKQGYGCMVMDQDGVIYIPEGFDIFKQAAAHAGKSAWNGISGMNSHFMGMEICNWGSDGAKHGADVRKISKKTGNQYPGTYQCYTSAQEISLANFCLWAKAKCPTFNLDNVAGHEECALPAGRKNDPGGSLSMTMPNFRAYLKSL